MRKKIIIGKLKALTGLHIGTGEPSAAIDSPVLRDAEGEIIVPGTTIGGVLRSLATRIAPHLGFKKCIAFDIKLKDFCDCPVCQLFGSITSESELKKSVKQNEKEIKKSIGNASRVWVYDSKYLKEPVTSIRDGVGIERESRTSSRAAQAKYDYELIIKNAEFSFRIDLEEAIPEDYEMLIAVVLCEWIYERCNLGGNISRGLGQMKLGELKVYSLDFSTNEKIINYLKNDDETKVAIEDKDWLKKNVEKARQKIIEIQDNMYLYNSFCQIDLTLKFSGGFIINDILNAVKTGYDFCPKLEGSTFVLPGSGFRGVLRSHAEKIMRTLMLFKVNNFDEYKVKCPACDPNTSDTIAPLASCSSFFKSNRQAIDQEVKDKELCLACRLFGSSFKGSHLFIRDGYHTDKVCIKIMDFLAIDRFTGGGKEGAKFNALALWHPEFKTQIFIENPENWELGLIMMLLRDLKDGLLSIGFGQNKWFGNVNAQKIDIKFGTISKNLISKIIPIKYYESLFNNYEGLFKIGKISYDDLLKQLQELPDLWIKSFHEELNSYQRDEHYHLKADTYLGTNLEKLYSKEEEV